MLASRSIENVMTRVRSAWNASARSHHREVHVDVVRHADRRLGNLQVARILLLAQLQASLDLAHGIEVGIDRDAIRRTERLLQAARLTRDAIENAARLTHDGRALLIRIALAKEPIEHSPRTDFLRQRLRRRAPRHLRAPARRGHLERR
jgi:hypothetical protein